MSPYEECSQDRPRRIGPLVELFRALIRAGPVVQMDETPVWVLREPGRENTYKSYMWLARGGPPQAPVCLYHYSWTRGAEYARDLLTDYEGYLQADGYRAYETIAGENQNMILVGCWAHARRKFFEATKASKKSGAAHEGMKKIKELYRVEQELRGEDLEEKAFLRQRREKIEPILAEMRAWLAKKSLTVVPGSLLGKAVGYTLKRWDTLVRYLDHAGLTPLILMLGLGAENAIRPFVLGSNNWLFNGSPRGAESSCAIYSVIETAKQNGLNPYAYLHYIFTRVPKITEAQEWETLLPQNLDPEEVNNALFDGVRWICRLRYRRTDRSLYCGTHEALLRGNRRDRSRSDRGGAGDRSAGIAVWFIAVTVAILDYVSAEIRARLI